MENVTNFQVACLHIINIKNCKTYICTVQIICTSESYVDSARAGVSLSQDELDFADDFSILSLFFLKVAAYLHRSTLLKRLKFANMAIFWKI